MRQANFVQKLYLSTLSLFLVVSTAYADAAVEFHRGDFGFSLNQPSSESTQLILTILGESCSRKDVFTLKNPARLVVDNHHAAVSYNKTLSIEKVSFLKEIRIGRHPNKTRLVLEFEPDHTFSYHSKSTNGHCELILAAGDTDEPVETAEALVEATVLTYSTQLDLSNRFGTRTSSSDNNSATANHLLATPKVNVDIGSNTNATFAVRLDSYYEDAEDSISDFNVFADELYFNATGDHYGVKIGNQKIRWGKTDEVSPLDIVSPEDLQDGLVRRRDDRKIPVPATSVLLFNDSFEAQGVFIPWFEESILPDMESEWSGLRELAEQSSINKESPGKSLEDAEYGIQLATTISQVDLSFNFLSTTDDQPVLEYAGTGEFLSPEFDLRYHRREVGGASFEYAGELIGFRGDIAYSNARYYQTEQLTPVRSPVSEFILGADYIGEEGLYVNLQFGGEYIHEYENSILGYDRFSQSFYGEISDEFWDSYLVLGTRSFYNFSTEGFFVNPYMVINYWDWGSLEFGADILDGDQGPLSRVKENDRIYFLAKCVL